MRIGEIVEKIELTRRQLNEMGGRQCLVDAEVIKISQQLDDLIIIYQRLLSQRESK
ncbi:MULTISPECIES: aspartyl-phosphate phosphatase Spo0E family protein [Pelosinus]|uniref:Sporulation stage 0, Spo0E-like regulatory phosphatase n=2 Tax=Pelosinus TaxID=365348 RepID=I8U241_9FIRM|nr:MULTISPECIES: aspartyl-phosphate phosphatase Spo0E family protein [Pelosinus]AJQ27904.1 Sporulation stage 0, Spo0E-like regulatory phosphatase [Pelosinus fermentans JBW45]MCC5465798.1 aspartyl-phosphate phosphatase Spo0E family protein [Pelosinus baikalensis]